MDKRTTAQLNEGLPATDPAKVAEKQAGALQADVAGGGAAGAALGGACGMLGGPADAMTGATAGAAAGALAGAIVATERGPAGDAVDMGKFGDAAVGPAGAAPPPRCD